mgnify:FL=1
MQAVSYRSKKVIYTIALFASFILVIACSDSQTKKEFVSIENKTKKAEGINVLYPFDQTVFPPEIPAPLFQWNDAVGNSSKWDIFLANQEGKIILRSSCDKNNWRPDSNDWENIKKNGPAESYSFTVIASNKSTTQMPSGRIRFSISGDSVGAGIFYRAVTLPFSYAVKNVKTIEWYMGNINGEKPRKMLDNLPACANCHSFSTGQPLLAMDVDYGNDKGSYLITEARDTAKLKPQDVISWSEFKRDDNKPTFGLLSQISPDGKHVLSTVNDLSVFVAIDENPSYSQLFFPIQGIVGTYNRQTKTFGSLKGANDPKYVQSNPTWSPDGRKVVFARTEMYVNENVRKAGRGLLSLNDVKEFSSGEKPFKYDLYTVDFNGGNGGVATPLPGASNNGKSNYFPKFSPDGKWIVFCQAENFMLLQRDSRLFIIPSSGGEPRLMNCNMNEMNSWHSWSPNGRWLVFSSKNNGKYTQLYLTHIDENGMDSPPVLLENLCFEAKAANIPEFFPFNADDFLSIKDDFSKTPDYYNRMSYDALSNKYFHRAMKELDEAMKINSNYLETYFSRIALNSMLKQQNSKQDLADKNKAMTLVNDSLSRMPLNENYLALKASLLSNMGKDKEALTQIENALLKFPQSYKLYDLKASIFRQQNQQEKAIDCYKKMITIDPNKKKSLTTSIAAAYMNLSRPDEALRIINQQIKEQPESDNSLLFTRAQLLIGMKDFAPAQKDIESILAKDSSNYNYQKLLAQLYFAQGNKRLYFFHTQKALQKLQNTYQNNNEDVEALFEIASIHLSMKQFDEAEATYNQILALFPDNYESLKQKARIKLTQQQWADAISIYDQLEANYKYEEEFLNNKAIAYIQNGNPQKALEYFEKAIELNPNNKDAIFNRNRLKAEMGNRN